MRFVNSTASGKWSCSSGSITAGAHRWVMGAHGHASMLTGLVALGIVIVMCAQSFAKPTLWTMCKRVCGPLGWKDNIRCSVTADAHLAN